MNIHNILCFEMDIFCWFHGGGGLEGLLLKMNLTYKTRRREILLLIKVENKLQIK